MGLFDLDTWQEIISTMGRNRLRTFMTAFGVFWGILILIVLLAFGNSLQSGVAQTMRGFGSEQIFVWGGRTTRPFQGQKPGRRISYSVEDIPVVRSADGVGHVAPRISLGGYRGSNNVKREGKAGPFKVIGDFPAWGVMQPFEYFEGRFINQRDIAESRKVAVIGEEVYRMLFPKGESALGATLLIQDVYFEVVGHVRSTRSGDSAESDASTVYIPFTTFQRAFQKGNRIGWFAITAQEGFPPSEVERNVRLALKRVKKVHPEDKQGIQGFNAAEQSQKIDKLFGGIRVFMWFVGLATLFAGALGVSNIMLIVVRERTKEIGIRKALGATPRAIIGSVMAESIALTLVAGYAGLFAAVLLIEGASGALVGTDAPLGPPQVDFALAVSALVILVLAGAIAGFIPARQAAAIQPVHALRAD